MAQSVQKAIDELHEIKQRAERMAGIGSPASGTSVTEVAKLVADLSITLIKVFGQATGPDGKSAIGRVTANPERAQRKPQSRS